MRTDISSNVNSAGDESKSAAERNGGAGGGVGVSMGIVQLIDCDIGHNRAFTACRSRKLYSVRVDGPHLGAARAEHWSRPCAGGYPVYAKYNDANVGAGVMVEGFGPAVDVTLIGCNVHHNVR